MKTQKQDDDILKVVIEFLIIVLGAIAVIAGIVLLLTLPVWLLWNWLMPQLFGFPTITIWQSMGLSALTHLLFTNPVSSNKK